MFSLPQFLLKPGTTTDLFQLCEHWRETVLSITCQLDPCPWELGIPPWVLAGKVRGAWGEELKRSASPQALAGEPCSWHPPCALDVFFRSQGNITGGLEICKPFVLRIDYAPNQNQVKMELSLFGLAQDYATAASASLACALIHRLRWAPGRQSGCKINDLKIETASGPMCAEAGMKARMKFISPLNQRKGNQCVVNPPSIITGMGSRLSGLARWHGLELKEDFSLIKDIAYSLQWEYEVREFPKWFRRSHKQGGKEIPMEGFLGDLWLRGDLVSLAPLLALGQRCHAGGRTALGMGRYHLHWQY